MRAGTAVMIGFVLITPLVLAGCSTASSSKDDTYGSLPSYLPKTSIRPDSMLTGSEKRPAITTEGDLVTLELPSGGSVVAEVDGPVVPGEGLPYQTGATTCTWTITVKDATKDVRIDPADFTSSDHLGQVYKVAFVTGQPKPSAILKPGQTETFELRAVMTVGEGLMRWAPEDHKILAAWDFEVEND